MNRKNHASVVRLTSLALLAALVVVLQTVASGIRIGPVPISLTLVPIVVGAILFSRCPLALRSVPSSSACPALHQGSLILHKYLPGLP